MGEVGGNNVRVRSGEFAKKRGIPEEGSLPCGVGGLRDMDGTASWGVCRTGAAGKFDLDGSGVKENGRARIGGSLVSIEGSMSTIEAA